MGEGKDQQTQAIEQAGGEAINEAFAMVSAAEILELPIETLLEGVYTPVYRDASLKSVLGLRRTAAICLLLYSEKSKEEREGEKSSDGLS